MQQLGETRQRLGELEEALLAIQEILDQVLEDEESDSDLDE